MFNIESNRLYTLFNFAKNTHFKTASIIQTCASEFSSEHWAE